MKPLQLLSLTALLALPKLARAQDTVFTYRAG